MIRVFIKILLTLLIILVSNSNAQKFGFGCLGLSGFYVGISEYHYKAAGVNNFVNNTVSSLASVDEKIVFNLGSGYRGGANFFRAQWENVFITTKGYFQFLKEEHTANLSLNSQHKFQLNMNQWGVAVDIGIPLTSFIDWKIVEGGVVFYNAELVHQQFADNSLSSEIKYSQEKAKPSYYVAAGIILHIIPDYMSLEGTASYHFINVDKFKQSGSDNGLITIAEPFSKNGFSGTIQLNISFPF